MNKRIQKKVAKRLDSELETTQGMNSAPVSAVKIAARPPRSVVHGHAHEQGDRTLRAQAQDAMRKGPISAVLSVAEQVQERANDTIQHVKNRIEQTETQIKERIAETEQKAEALLEKVPLVGGAAARKLHDLTHR